MVKSSKMASPPGAVGRSGHLVEEFDAAFQNCLSAIMKQEHFNVTDQEETKSSVDQCVQKFVDIAKQLESFFLQKRLLLSVRKPEQIIKEDITELRLELQRKDYLIHKHYEKLAHWQGILSRQAPGSTQTPQQQQQQQQQQQGQPQPQPPPPQQQQQSPGVGMPQSPATGHPPMSAPLQSHPSLIQQHSQPGVMASPSPGSMTGINTSGMTGGMMSGPAGMSGPNMGHGMAGGASMQGSPGIAGGPGALGMAMGHGGHIQHQPGFPQGPLAYLEQTTSNIGMPERR